MSTSRNRTEANLARNLRWLMDQRGLSEDDVAKLSGVAQKTINNALHQVYRLKLETAEQLAKGFKIEAWDIISPTFIEDIESGRFERFKKLREDWGATDDEGRKFISDIAEREAKRKKGNGR